MNTTTSSRSLGTRLLAHVYLCATLALVATLSWLRADQPIDDRGSDATEKAQNIILAVTLGTIVTGGAVALITKLNGEW